MSSRVTILVGGGVRARLMEWERKCVLLKKTERQVTARSICTCMCARLMCGFLFALKMRMAPRHSIVYLP